MISIAHILHPVVVPSTSDLTVAQPITFETVRRARDFARNQVDVQILSTCYHDESPGFPGDFERAPDLKRSTMESASFRNARKLAFLKDILDRLYASSNADYLIYTNVDIAVLPNFYVTIAKLIESGCDAMVINRRTIPGHYANTDDIDLMYAEIGKEHPGYDCFVFRRDSYPKFILREICIGTNWIGRALITNIICYSESFDLYKDLHLTFHIGDDRSWRSNRFQDYDAHNRDEFRRILEELEKRQELKKTELVSSFTESLRHSGNKSLRRRVNELIYRFSNSGE